MNIHELKIWPDFYRPLVAGKKNFELRFDDRGFAVGDVLFLREWDPKSSQYTGKETRRKVTYIGKAFGLAPGYVCLAIEAFPRV